MSSSDLFAVLSEVRRRSTEAVLGQSGVNHPGLAAELRRQFNSPDPLEGGLLAEPVIEAAPRYVEAQQSMAELAGDLLSPALVDVLDGAVGSAPRDRERYVFRREWRPYKHQLDCWHALLSPRPQSVLVTSGTGSGKTECFLIPVLEDLVRQGAGARDLGVQAIILYPLNALIASQEERLSDWTRPFDGRVRFALYNGLMEDREPRWKRDARPEAVIDRATLRQAPPPVLVTNVTMLEYMLLRKEDRPILDASQGKLRYIVLDEAHSYVGAQAAEIALLLRRVCLAFGVQPQDVRFVATSATIGGPDAEEELRRFLSDVSGAPLERVSVIKGAARWPQLPEAEASPKELDLTTLSPEQAYEVLSKERSVRPLLEKLREGPVLASAFEGVARQKGASGAELITALAAASREGEQLSPLRVHAFQRAIGGVWTCINPGCGGQKPAQWPFGSVLTHDEDVCPHCGTGTFEIVHCTNCGEPWLETLERANGSLVRPVRRPARDEFGAELDQPEGEEEGSEEGDEGASLRGDPGHERLLAVRPFQSSVGSLRPLLVDIRGGRVCDSPGDGVERFLGCLHDGTCLVCGQSARSGSGAVIRPLTYGTPFLLPVAAPIVLEAMPAAERRDEGEEHPLNGRQLLTFTDSRQGTARLSAKLQTASERNLIRSIIYHQLQAQLRSSPDTTEQDQNIASLRAAIASNPTLEPTLTPTLQNLEKARAERLSAVADGLPWDDLADKLASRWDVELLRQLWAEREPRYENATRFANFLLLRELLRRPRRANTVETLGLAQLRFPEIDGLPSAVLPGPFRGFGGDIEDWKSFLATLVTFTFRAYSAVEASKDDQHWIQPKVFLKSLVRRGQSARRSADVYWPWIAEGQAPLGRPGRAVVLLKQAFALDLEQPEVRADVQEVLDAAWNQLARLTVAEGDSRKLDLRKARVAPMSQAWWCPRSRRLIDHAFRTLSPYGADALGAEPAVAARVEMPLHPFPFPDRDRRLDLVEWLRVDENVCSLRELGAWSNLSDRVALFSDYFRSAEHSAQQRPQLLRAYEAQFKSGAINILNCSTTMEMGVDIGSVSAVMMTNTPPSLASYRQRVGRAGRRGQGVALGFTICKDRPLDRSAFQNPVEYLERSVRAPRIALHSPVIVQRHVNALLFADFMHTSSADGLKLQAGTFFGCEAVRGAAEITDSPAALLIRHARQPSIEARVGPAVAQLTAGSALEGDRGVFLSAADTLESVRRAFSAEWHALQALLVSGGDTALLKGLELQLRRLCEDYLLSVLAERGFLPSHGFPTGVVTFRCRIDDEGSSGRHRSWPQRSLDVALREYAPGAEVVLDGLVHKSAGVTLNWKKPVSAESVQREVQNLLWRWRCSTCTQSGTDRIRAEEDQCPSCGGIASWMRYLEPAGFAADLRERPHADADDVGHVPAEPPVVTSGGCAWQGLFDPKLGRMRSNPAGGVFFCNSGEARLGYKLCLHCGRAEPESAAGAAEDTGWDHSPLLGKSPVGGVCEGSAKPFAIQRKIRLGYEILTDVFELQVTAVTDRGAGLALASALREALARRLGVEADEMGIAAEVRAGPVGRCVSVFLFDRASGGAGFSEQAGRLFYDLLKETDSILDCSVEGCVRGCPACVLTGDMNEEDAAELDRVGALEAIRDLLSDGLSAPEDEAQPGARLCRHVLDTLEAQARETRRAVFRIGGDLDPTALSAWPAASTVRHLRDLGVDVAISVPQELLETLDGAALLSFRDWIAALDVNLEISEGRGFANGARALAELVGKQGRVRVFAARDALTFSASERWGQPQDHPVVTLETTTPTLDGREIGRSSLAPKMSASVRLLGQDLDGDLAGFGARAAHVLRELLSSTGRPLVSVRRLVYVDRFLTSPLTARLCLDTLSALASGNAEVTLRVASARRDERPPRSLQHDWASEETRAAVLSAYGRQRGLTVRVSVGQQPHGRRLDIEFDDGRAARIWLDQGFGPWRTTREMPFDFRAAEIEQVRQLKGVNTLLASRGETYVVAEWVDVDSKAAAV